MIKIYYMFTLLILCLSGCGITSKNPILNKYESDKFSQWVGYMACQIEPNDKKKNDIPILINDNSSGYFFRKDYIYTAGFLGEDSEAYSFRVKANNQTYAFQAATSKEDNKSELEYFYFFGISNGNNIDFYETFDRNLSPEVKAVLADTYINATQRSSIHLSDEFVTTKGKVMIDALAQGIPKANLPDRHIASCHKISMDQAIKMVDENRAKEQEKKKKEAENSNP